MSLCCIKELLVSISFAAIGIVIVKLIYDYIQFDKIFFGLKDKRVLITGGSSGIGLSLAKLAYQYGAHVTIVSRSTDKLELAKEEIIGQNNITVGTIDTMSVDVSAEYELLQNNLQSKIGKIDILINCAGGAVSRTYIETEPSDIEGQMRLNYFGSANVTKIFLPSMLEMKKESSIVFVSSMAGQVGVYGLAAYSASKFALRGLAESLRMEIEHLGVNITLAFPPDTRTPGYNNEQIGKPETTKKISESAGLIEPDHVAKCIWGSVLRKEFFSSVGLDGWFLTKLTYGMVLPGSIVEALSVIIFAPLAHIIGVGYGLWIRYIISTTNVNK